MELFNRKALEFYTHTPPTELEKIEDIGALRFLEYGIPIHYDIVESESLSIDTPKDLEAVIAIISRNTGNKGEKV